MNVPNCNHTEICKPASAESPPCTQLLIAIQTVLQEQQQVAAQTVQARRAGPDVVATATIAAEALRGDVAAAGRGPDKRRICEILWVVLFFFLETPGHLTVVVGTKAGVKPARLRRLREEMQFILTWLSMDRLSSVGLELLWQYPLKPPKVVAQIRSRSHPVHPDNGGISTKPSRPLFVLV